MYSGQSEETILKVISKGGDLYSIYEGKNRIIGLVYADLDKKRCKNLLHQFFSQLHFMSGTYLDFFCIGYRSRREVTDKDFGFLKINDEDLSSEYEDNIPFYFDRAIFHKHNEFYLSKNKWSEKLGNSSFYITFFDVFDGVVNHDSSFVVNFVRKSQEEDEEFMHDFVMGVRKAIQDENVNLASIEKILDKNITSDYIDRLFKVVKLGALVTLEVVVPKIL